ASVVCDTIQQLTTPEQQRKIIPTSHVIVRDDGEKYEITVSTPEQSVERSYSDPLRECDRRTRFVAVFAILTLMPPEIGSPKEPNELPEPPPMPPPKPMVPPPTPIMPSLPPPALRSFTEVELSKL